MLFPSPRGQEPVFKKPYGSGKKETNLTLSTNSIREGISRCQTDLVNMFSQVLYLARL